MLSDYLALDWYPIVREYPVAIREMTSLTENTTVSPSDSASQNGVPGSDMQTADLGSSVGSLILSLPAAYTAMDKGSYQQYVGVVQTGLATISRAVGYQCTAVRVASSGGSVASSSSHGSSGSSAGCSVGGKYTRLAHLKSMKSWRPKAVPDGFCYTKLLKSSEAEGRAADLQQWPSLASLLKLPATAFQSMDELERFRVVGDSSSVHVRAGGDGTPFLSAVSRVAQGLKTQPGTFGAVIRASAVPPASLRLTARTIVGGSRRSSVRKKDCTVSLRVVLQDVDGKDASHVYSDFVADCVSSTKVLPSFTECSMTDAGLHLVLWYSDWSSQVVSLKQSFYDEGLEWRGYSVSQCAVTVGGVSSYKFGRLPRDHDLSFVRYSFTSGLSHSRFQSAISSPTLAGRLGFEDGQLDCIPDGLGLTHGYLALRVVTERSRAYSSCLIELLRLLNESVSFSVADGYVVE